MERKGQYLFLEFHNLTEIELSYPEITKHWLEALEVLKHCPKLQILTIVKNGEFSAEGDEGLDWPYPQSVPICISSQLKTCCLDNYDGPEGYFGFARYIRQNARHIKNMTIYSNNNADQGKKHDMIKKLSLCRRCSATCKLSFD